MNKKSLLLLIYLGTFLGPFAGNLVLPLIPLLESDFNIGIETAALTITAAIIPFAVLQIFSGGLSDIYGRKKVAVLGYAVSAAGAVLASLSLNINLFICARVIQGAGAAFISPIMLAMIGDFFPYEERGKIMGGYAAATSAGVALGPIVGGSLAIYSWRYAFLLTAILSVAVIPLCMLYLETARRREKVFETLPKIMFSSLKQFNVSLASIVGLLVFLVTSSTLTFLSDYLGKPPLLVNAAEIGFLLFIAGVVSILIAPAVGVLIDAVGCRKTAVIGGILLLLAFIVFTLTGRIYWQFLVPLIVMFVGQSFVFTALGAVIIDSTARNRGAASSIYNTFRFIGYGLGPALMSPVYITSSLTGVLSSLILLTVIVLLLLTRVRTEKTETLG